MAVDEAEFEKLALDTLLERRQRRQQCFVWNQAGEELRACPPAALPVIERIIRETVESVISEGTANTRVFHGLDHLLGAYLLITARSEPERAVQFLFDASTALQVEVLGAMRVFFYFKADGYNCGIAPPAQFRAFVRELAGSKNRLLRSAAQRTLLDVVWGS